MITRVDAARICACAEEVQKAMGKLVEQLDSVLADIDEPGDSEVLAHLKGARMKAGAAQLEMRHADQFACAARTAAFR